MSHVKPPPKIIVEAEGHASGRGGVGKDDTGAIGTVITPAVGSANTTETDKRTAQQHQGRAKANALKHDAAEKRRAKWRRLAKRIGAKHPGWSKLRIGREIVKKHPRDACGCKADYIARKI